MKHNQRLHLKLNISLNYILFYLPLHQHAFFCDKKSFYSDQRHCQQQQTGNSKEEKHLYKT